MAWATRGGGERAKRFVYLLDLVLTIFGLSCVSMKDDKYVLSKKKLIMPCTIVLVLFYLAVYVIYHSNFVSENIGSTVVSAYLDLTGNLVAALYIVSATLNTKRYAKMKAGFLSFDRSISFDIGVITRNSSKYFALYLTVYAVSFLADFILYQYDNSPIAGVKLLTNYIFQVYNIVGIFHFSFCLFWLRKSFSFINVDVMFQSTMMHKVKNNVSFEFLPRNIVNPSTNEVVFFPYESEDTLKKPDQKTLTMEKVRFLRCLYHEVYQLSREVNNVFGTRNVLAVGHNFVLGTIFIYGGISESVKYMANPNNSMPLIEVFVNLKWSFISFLSIYGLIWPSTSTCSELSLNLKKSANPNSLLLPEFSLIQSTKYGSIEKKWKNFLLSLMLQIATLQLFNQATNSLSKLKYSINKAYNKTVNSEHLKAWETRINIQELLTKSLQDDLRSELQSFALQFNHEVVTFSPHGFFSLNNNLLLSIIGAVVSYLVVLIQFRITMA